MRTSSASRQVFTSLWNSQAATKTIFAAAR
jgi:hypothetical protein